MLAVACHFLFHCIAFNWCRMNQSESLQVRCWAPTWQAEWWWRVFWAGCRSASSAWTINLCWRSQRVEPTIPPRGKLVECWASKSNLHFTHCVTLRRITSGGIHLRGLMLVKTAQKNTSDSWRVPVFDLTGPEIELQISRSAHNLSCAHIQVILWVTCEL